MRKTSVKSLSLMRSPVMALKTPLLGTSDKIGGLWANLDIKVF